MEILIAVLILGGVALLLGLMLSYASKVFAVPQDEKEIWVSQCDTGAAKPQCSATSLQNKVLPLCEAPLIPNAASETKKNTYAKTIKIILPPFL